MSQNPEADASALGATVVEVRESLVLIEVDDKAAVKKNEVGFVHVGEERLKAEVLRIRGRTADMQVFEDTSGVRVGDAVEMTDEMLSAVLGPGLLGNVFDGLQNPLHVLADQFGFFLPRGATVPPLNMTRTWEFTPTVSSGDRVPPGGVLGTVPEGPFVHKIMVPFGEREPVTVSWIGAGHFTLQDVVARIESNGQEREVTMMQRWPVRKPIPESLIRRQFAERLFSQEPLTTGTRIIDAFFPIAMGGTGCIPGPFGAGKTVLQSTIARYSSVDIVVVVACGERAGEVVETITLYPETHDPRTGGTLMDRTIIICNTSSMPVAAREASIYMGITLAEYYRQMGLNVLLIADSTSRWAQAMRETSGRMEEIPGEEAFPAYLDSSIKSVYERAGVIQCPDGSQGSLTMIGTVSPAGGNFEEPVTQSTLGTVKTFLGLSYDRAYKRFYPAIDPLISWSRYLGQLDPWLSKNLDPNWGRDIAQLRQLLLDGDTINQMMQVTGEEGITLEDFVTWQKSVLIDMAFLQQDAFDEVDACMPRPRQLASLRMIKRLVTLDFGFTNRDEARNFFTQVTGLYKNWNYSPPDSPDYAKYEQAIETAIQEQLAK
ncbi:V-type ATP synthase subunit A [Blastopirellula sp. JC732]|uniref:V-type ATP synthase alpha chain n=1 Tax=Blastopirellula sediminis TaxID=2894196 RepID=A0A9X1MN62_9BACT|nr:V-type ATP synthase subunit A [Blastopirellula sediminis]MCC9608286.1 V-type ATP synthase subunit A [Blastopirellula sediminis]MCC9628957.1 V-type ATP synthase subunit A [Blastopirellula sediminis]